MFDYIMDIIGYCTLERGPVNERQVNTYEG